MIYSYFPGCTLRNKAKDLDAYARASAKALGFELQELEDWQCGGGVYPLGSDEIASKLPSVRALNSGHTDPLEGISLREEVSQQVKNISYPYISKIELPPPIAKMLSDTPYGYIYLVPRETLHDVLRTA